MVASIMDRGALTGARQSGQRPHMLFQQKLNLHGVTQTSMIKKQ